MCYCTKHRLNRSLQIDDLSSWAHEKIFSTKLLFTEVSHTVDIRCFKNLGFEQCVKAQRMSCLCSLPKFRRYFRQYCCPLGLVRGPSKYNNNIFHIYLSLAMKMTSSRREKTRHFFRIFDNFYVLNMWTYYETRLTTYLINRTIV